MSKQSVYLVKSGVVVEQFERNVFPDVLDSGNGGALEVLQGKLCEGLSRRPPLGRLEHQVQLRACLACTPLLGSHVGAGTCRTRWRTVRVASGARM